MPSAPPHEGDAEVPSPDGRFAVCTFGEPWVKDCVIRERETGRVLAQTGASCRSTDPLWSADSQAVVISINGGTSAPSEVQVFVQREGKFVAQTLPELHDPALRPQDDHNPNLFHWLCLGRWEPVRWKRDGSLVLRGHSAANGNGDFAHAWTILTLAPRRHGPWKVVSETHRYSTDQSGGPTEQLLSKWRYHRQ